MFYGLLWVTGLQRIALLANPNTAVFAVKEETREPILKASESKYDTLLGHFCWENIVSLSSYWVVQYTLVIGHNLVVTWSINQLADQVLFFQTSSGTR